MSVSAAVVEPVAPMPRGIHNAYIFDVFNTISWTVVMGAPMLLYLQHLRATATILAVSASLAPLLNILQIPAARFVEQVGYRRFVVSGWTGRSVLIVGMTMVAFLPDSFDRATRIVLMLFLALIYNALRGVSLCGLLPWFTHIVPEGRRGEYLSRDQTAVALAGMAALLFFGLLLEGDHPWYSFGIVFATSAVAAFLSLIFLRRIPDVPVEKIVMNPHPMPWREMLFYPPFFKYIQYNVVVNVALGVANVFWVPYFRAFLHVSEANTLLVACAINVVLGLALFSITPLIDRTGNKQVLTLAGIFLSANFLGWAFIAAGLLPFNHLLLAAQIFTAGVGAALWNLANVRYVMAIIPVMGRPHFLALYSVASNVTFGLVPLGWGPIMDALGSWHVAWGAWVWNSYSLLYAMLTATTLLGLAMVPMLVEPKSMTWDVFIRELFVETPSRALSRLISRMRLPGGG
jgi:MFS family permease